ncbi:MAG: competence protein TfoX [Chloroflexi bacterium HGW-Chloroflexi-4]|jgi:TfoX/Sxy family transcriptional regulator of competence genes|nr:MAG: competence protein TfoX [Chloroflexi bacterium HGW-Chloroflexi-4]
MASDEEFLKFLAEQMDQAGAIRYRKMFGEYAIYCNEKVVALVCDNKLYVKPTEAGRKFIRNVEEAPPYSGAKPFFFIEDRFEDADWLSELVKITEQELPVPKPKKNKVK